MHERKGTTVEVRSDGAGRAGAPGDGEGRRGPRGGTTTTTASGFVKKNFWMADEAAEELRRLAFETRRSEAEIIREALDRFFAAGREVAG